MNRLTPRLCIVLAASAAALAAATALADPAPVPPPPGPSPQPVPYPGDGQPPPDCANRFCIPKPGTIQGVAEHKHIAGVKYEDATMSATAADVASGSTNGKRMHKPYSLVAEAGEPVIQVQSISWGKLEGAGPLNSADPMEGGQIAERYRPGRQKPGNITAVNVASDPEEGGQVSAARADMTAVPLTPDQAPPVTGTAGTSAKVSATFKTLAGACVKGQHLNKVMITAREGSYRLHDVTVADVAPAEDGMETVTVSFASVDD